MTEILDRDNLYISSEKDVFDSAISWISNNSCDTKQKKDLLGYSTVLDIYCAYLTRVQVNLFFLVSEISDYIPFQP